VAQEREVLPLAEGVQRDLQHPRRQVAPLRQEDPPQGPLRRVHLLRHLHHAGHPHQRGTQVLQPGGHQHRCRPGLNDIKRFLSMIYGFLYLARVFVILDWKSLPVKNTLAYYKKP